MKSFFSASNELHQAGTPFAVVTLVSVRGHAPQEPGAKIIVTSEGLYFGTIGGGKIEAKCIDHAKNILSQSVTATPPELFVWNLQKDIGMSCGGEATVLFETHKQTGTFRVVIFGAGHVAQAVTRTLAQIDCFVTCVDPRAEWIEKLEKSPRLKTICIPDIRESLNQFDKDCFFVVMTRGHASDMVILEAIFKKFPDAKYVGCLGSKVKALKLKSELRSLGFKPEALENFHSPIGLELGSSEPSEIAISVSAQLLLIRDKHQKN